METTAAGTRIQAGMEAMTGKGRVGTADSFVAGLGASGGMIAAAVVVFLLLLGLVAFDAFPRAAGLRASVAGCRPRSRPQ